MKLLLLLLLCASPVLAQNVIMQNGQAINEIVDGKRTGLWKIFDLERNIIVSCVMDNGELASSVDFYQNGKLLFTQSKTNDLIFYRDSKRIYGKVTYIKQEISITYSNGAGLEEELTKLYKDISTIKAIYYGGHKALAAAVDARLDHRKIGNHYGKVNLQFRLDHQGYVDTLRVVKSEDEFLNDEAMRIVKSLPRFQPGLYYGRISRMFFTLPITFSEPRN